MEFDDVIKKRISIRNFGKKKVKWADVLEAVDSSLQGPFAGNKGNLNFLIVEDEKKIKDISKFCNQDWISQMSILVIVCSNDEQLESVYGLRGRVYSRQQAGASIQTLIFKLTDMGLDSCWVGAYDDSMIRKRLEIPKYIQIEAVIPIGYRSEKEKHEKKGKRNLDNSLFWDKWDQSKRPSLFEEDLRDLEPKGKQ